MLVADRVLAFAEGMSQLLQSAGIPARAVEPSLLEMALGEGCEVLVVDGDNEAQAVDLVQGARLMRPAVKILFLVSGSATRPQRLAASVGSATWLSRQSSGDSFVEAVGAILAHDGILTGAGRSTRTIPDDLRADQLTPREITVLRLLAQAKGNKDIGETLHISPHTVRTHVQNLLFKLGAHSRNEAVAIGLRIGALGDMRSAMAAGR